MKPAPSSSRSDDSRDAHHGHASLWPLIVTAMLTVMAMALTIRGGLQVDDRGVPPEYQDQLSLMASGAMLGAVDILLRSSVVLAMMAMAGWGAGQWTSRLLMPAAGQLVHVTAGLGFLWLGYELLGLMGLATPAFTWGWWIACVLAGIAAHRKIAGSLVARMTDRQRSERLVKAWQGKLAGPWSMLLAALPVAMLLTAACCPPGSLWAVEAWGYDVLSYHLQIPREWLALGRITGLEHNVYSYLPSLVEVAFLQLGAVKGSMYDAMYACQLLSAGLMMLAATHLGLLVRERLAHQGCTARLSAAAGWFTAAIFLATPWVLITGSMAYDEAAVLALGAAALRVMFMTVAADESRSRAWLGQALLVGLLAGLATQAKLTGGFMIALPLGAGWLVSFTRDGEGWRRPILGAAAMAMAGLLVLLPYFARNALWTGNPVFPFATAAFGPGHWDDALVDRWQRGHHVEESFPQRLTALGQHWVFNTGYGGIAGRPRITQGDAPEARNVAYFPTQYGIPTLLLLAMAGWGVMMTHPPHRKAAIVLAVMLLLQVIAWLFVTHLQSRFMVFSLLPVCTMAGLGTGLATHRFMQSRLLPLHATAIVMLLMLVSINLSLLRNQTAGQAPLWQAVASLGPAAQLTQPPDPSQGQIDTRHPINRLGPRSKTLLVADNARLFFLQRPIVYHSAFDASPLGQLIREHPGDPAAVTQALKARGITHVWVHLPELARLMSTYGHDPSVTPQTLQSFVNTGWRDLPYPHAQPGIHLYQLP